MMVAASDPNITPDMICTIIDNAGIYPEIETAFRNNPAWDLLVLADPSIEMRIAKRKAGFGIFGGIKPIGFLLDLPRMPIRIQP